MFLLKVEFFDLKETVVKYFDVVITIGTAIVAGIVSAIVCAVVSVNDNSLTHYDFFITISLIILGSVIGMIIAQ